jgi:hypothetical protein
MRAMQFVLTVPIVPLEIAMESTAVLPMKLPQTEKENDDP